MKNSTKIILNAAKHHKILDQGQRRVLAGAIRDARQRDRKHAWRTYYLNTDCWKGRDATMAS